MYIQISYKFHGIPDTQFCVIAKVHDLLGQPSYMFLEKLLFTCKPHGQPTTFAVGTRVSRHLLHIKDGYLLNPYHAWVKVFRIIPEFRILRLTFHRKAASKS